MLNDELLDMISDAIGNSMGPDWSYRLGAQYVAEALEASGLLADTARLRRALKPFADLADYISENAPGFDSDVHEFQVGGLPYSLSVGWIREARAALHQGGEAVAAELRCPECDGEGLVEHPHMQPAYMGSHAEHPGDPPLIECEYCRGSGTVEDSGEAVPIFDAQPVECQTCGDTGEVAWRDYSDWRDVADPPLEPCPDCTAADAEGLQHGK